MRTKFWKAAIGAVAGATMAGAAVADEPKTGGILNFVVASKMPSYDGHVETTFGVIHPLAPLYSLLIRVNPNNPADPTDFECDLCTSWEANADETVYTFKIRKGVTFHDGTPLTAQDILATYQKIIFPPEGVASARKSFYLMVDKVEAPGRRDRGLHAEVPVGRVHPGAGQPVQLGLLEEGPGRARADLAPDQHQRVRPVHGHRDRAGRHAGCGQEPQLPPGGAALSGRLQGHHRHQDVGPRAGDRGRPGGHRVPRLPAQAA